MTNEELVTAIQSGDNAATETLYTQNSGIIHNAIKHFIGVCDPEDLEQQAFIIMIDAAEDYQETQGTTFCSYFYRRLLWGFNRYCYRSENERGLSPKALTLLNKYKAFKNDYMQTVGSTPSMKDAVFFLRLSGSEKKLLEQALSAENMLSLAMEIGEKDGATLEDLIEDPANPYEEVEERLDQEKDADTIRKAVKALPESEARVISGKYFDDLTQEAIASRDDISPDKVRRLLMQGQSRLKHNEKLQRMAAERRLSSGAYKGGYRLFVSTGLSSVEHEVFHNMRLLREGI